MALDFTALALGRLSTLNTGLTGSGGWDRLQEAFKPVCSVPYRGGRRVHVYESPGAVTPGANKNGTLYLCTPVLLLDPRTATQRYLSAKNCYGVSFDIVVWNKEIENILLDYMEKQLKLNVVRGQIKPIPFDELMLQRRAYSSYTYECPNEWLPNELRNVVTFTLICPTIEGAESVAQAMRTQPEKFDSAFEMKLRLVPKDTKPKETVVRVDCTLNNSYSELLLKLRQRFNRAELLLWPEDADNLLSEATDHVMTQNPLSKEVETNSKNQKTVRAVLRSMLVMGEQITLDSLSTKKARRSLFWDQAQYRPDLVANELNKVYIKLDREAQVKLVEFVSETNWSESLDRVVSSLGIGKVACNSLGQRSIEANSSGAIASLLLRKVEDCATPSSGLHQTVKNLHNPGKKSKKLSFEERVRAVVIMFSYIKWQNGKFVPKLTNLTRINLTELCKGQNLKDIKLVKSPSVEVFTEKVSINTDVEAASFDDNEDLSVRIRHLQVQSNDCMSLVKSTEKETSRRIEVFNATINQLTQKVANLDKAVADSVNDTKKNCQLLDNKVNQFKEQLLKLISDTRADSVTMTKELDSKVELLKGDLLKKEASLRQTINHEKESILREVSNVKSTNAREHEEIKISLVSVKRYFEQETELVKKKSLDAAEKMTGEIAQVRRELSIVQSSVMNVSQSVRNTQALLSNAEANFKKETAQIRQQTSDVSTKLNGEIAQVRTTVSHNADETARQMNDLKSSVSSLQQKRKVFFSAQLSETQPLGGEPLVFSASGLLNEGWGIDLEKGTFTVPRDGCYAILFNSLSGLKKGKTQSETTAVSLMRNEEQIAATRAEEETPFTLSIVQQLSKGDRLCVVLHHGALRLSVGEYKTGEYEKPLGPISVFSAFSLD